MTKINKEIRLAITMGDPSGIGPEIILKTYKNNAFPPNCIPLIIGSEKIFKLYNDIMKYKIEIRKVDYDEKENIKKLYKKNILAIFEPSDRSINELDNIQIGYPDKITGKTSYECIINSIKLTQKGYFDAICTAPISKTALNYAGIKFPGHTEILAHFSKTKNYAMLLEGGGIRVVIATIHIALKDVFNSLTSEKILSLLKLIKKFFVYYNIPEPRIGVTGLNPHAGEGGMFGSEEKDIIEPAIIKAREKNINAMGPFPADTLFHRMLDSEFDVILAMYHDQGLIPVKTLGFHNGVNITMGLPFIRTSPDHGTAFDKAGKNLSRPDSFISACHTACLLASNKISINHNY